MRNFTRFSGAAAGLVASLTIVPSAFAAGNFLPQAWGEAPNEIVDRVVKITPRNKSIGVTQNEIVKFVDASSGRAFVVRADTPGGAFDLNRVAGPDFAGGRHILVYVWDTPGDASG